MKLIRYEGDADYRVLNSDDLPLRGEEGEVLEEEAWDYTWGPETNHEVQVDPAHFERILAEPGFSLVNPEVSSDAIDESSSDEESVKLDPEAETDSEEDDD